MAAAPVDLGWTPERCELLPRLLAEGLSSSQIAVRLGGGLSRNAVLGKVHRLGLAGSYSEARRSAENQHLARQARGTPPVPSRPELAPPTRSPAPSPAEALPPHAVTLADLRNLEGSCRHCRFILGEVRGPDGTAYCGRETTEPKAPYCAEHAARCYTAPLPRARLAPMLSVPRAAAW